LYIVLSSSKSLLISNRIAAVALCRSRPDVIIKLPFAHQPFNSDLPTSDTANSLSIGSIVGLGMAETGVDAVKQVQGGMSQTVKDLTSGAAGGIAQVLIGT
jgi:hypothetical protein